MSLRKRGVAWQVVLCTLLIAPVALALPSAAFAQASQPGSAQEPQSGSSGEGIVTVGAGTRSEVTTGSSGRRRRASPSASAFAGTVGRPQGPPSDANLCEKFTDATVQRHCVEKVEQ